MYEWPELPPVQIGEDREGYTASILGELLVLRHGLVDYRLTGLLTLHSGICVELLNQLGILWSNRAIPTRALCFFQACERFCTARDELAAASEAAATSEEIEADDNEDDSAASSLLSLRDVRAHANFYLAQVYGSLNLPDASAQCCLATLELQLRGLLLLSLLPISEEDEDETQEVEGVQDWVKNCLRLVDYYLAADNLKDAATCLSACEFLQSAVKSKSEKSDDDEENSQVQRAEIHLNWAKLHHLSLKIAQFRKEGYEPSPALLASATTATMERTLAKAAARISSPFESNNHYVPFDAITSFDIARQVFKMGMSACEGAKQVFVLDGFVTQYVRILQLESLFYKRLLHFEMDLKRQIAMQLRRLNILSPLLQEQLNPDAYCALLQEVNYECAEIAAEVFDLKQEKKSSVVDGKTTAYALKAINWYQQYLLLFYPSTTAATTRREGEGQQQQQQQLPSGTAVHLPSTSMTANELRSVLLGYFGLARVCGRLQFPKQKEKTVLFWKQSLAYHQSVLELVRKFEQLGATAGGEHAQANALHELFHAELNISKEMAELLPEKINQLVYNDKLL